MIEIIEIDKDKLLEVIWGICLSDNFGDVMESIKPLIKALGINSEYAPGQGELLGMMKHLDLIPESQRENFE